MNKQFDNQLNLFLKLKAFFANNASTYANDANLNQLVSELNTDITLIFDLNMRVLKKAPYTTTAKADSKNKLAELLITYNAKLKVWFMAQSDTDAPLETRLAASGISRAADAQLLLIAIKTYDYVQANIVALLPYGFTATMQTELHEVISEYENISDMPMREIENRRKDNITMTEAIESTRKLVRFNITTVMGPYKHSHPSFYGLFTIMARLGEPGTRTMALRVKAETANGKPIEGCKVMVKPSGQNHKPLQTITKTSGRVNFQNVPDGMCTITLTLPNSQTLKQQTEIKPSERADVVFVVEEL